MYGHELYRWNSLWHLWVLLECATRLVGIRCSDYIQYVWGAGYGKWNHGRHSLVRECHQLARPRLHQLQGFHDRRLEIHHSLWLSPIETARKCPHASIFQDPGHFRQWECPGKEDLALSARYRLSFCHSLEMHFSAVAPKQCQLCERFEPFEELVDQFELWGQFDKCCVCSADDVSDYEESKASTAFPWNLQLGLSLQWVGTLLLCGGQSALHL